MERRHKWQRQDKRYNTSSQQLGWPTWLTLPESIIGLDIDSHKQGGLEDDLETVQIEDKTQTAAFDRLEAKIDVDDALTHLTDIEVDIVKYHYGLMDGEQWSFPRIGEYFGFSATKANRLHSVALKKLKKFFEAI